MKKLIVAVAAILSIAVGAQAATYSFEGYKEDFSMGCVGGYDAEGNLIEVRKTKLNKSADALITEDLDFSDAVVRVRLYVPGVNPISDGVLLNTPAPETTPVPDVTPKPETTPKPTVEPSDDVGLPPTVDEQFPEVYKTEAFAYAAPAMVKKVVTAYQDGDIVYKTTLLFWGSEREFTFDSDFLIEQASDNYSDAIGQNASYLKAGDIILLGYPFKTEPRDMCLLYRPDSDPIDYDEFTPLFTTEGLAGGKWPVSQNAEAGYLFGVINRVDNRYISLLQKDGLADNELFVPILSDTIVYSYDVSDTKSAEVDSTGSIFPSQISDEDLDEDGNVIQWNPDYSRSYALVRVIDGAAADIMLFENF